jgi:peptide/nickel transport system substrate-binding protein
LTTVGIATDAVIMIRQVLACLLFAAPVSTPAVAQTLRVGMAAETDSADPHHFAMAPNSTLQRALYRSLTTDDAAGKLVPDLADHWERTDDLTWRFHLRPGVRFSNGASLGAPDVVATFCRILNNKEEQVASFSHAVRRLDRVVAEGEDVVVLHTAEPEPLLASDVGGLAILPRSLMPAGVQFDAATACGGGEGYPTVADFNDGRAAIGAGPFRQTSYERGGTIVLARNPYYSGPTPHWAEVRLSPILQPAARLASLLAGDQDLIEAPGTADIPRVRADKRFVVTAAPTLRLLFLQLDVARDPSPFVVGRNALKDVRVRQALSLALNREAIVARIMDGVALPAAQFLPTGLPGTIPGLPVLPYDPGRAKALLEAAGYKDGFALTLDATNNRYVNDGPLAQAIAQQWQRIGVRVTVDTLPAVSFFPRRGKHEFSVAMGGWATGAAETLGFFRAWLSTEDAALGLGTSNYGGWSDPAFDREVRTAMVTMDEDARAGLLRQASARALEQMPVIPLHFESAVWAARAGLHYAGRSDQTTRPDEVTEDP